jgi:hypothetical protein
MKRRRDPSVPPLLGVNTVRRILHGPPPIACPADDDPIRWINNTRSLAASTLWTSPYGDIRCIPIKSICHKPPYPNLMKSYLCQIYNTTYAQSLSVLTPEPRSPKSKRDYYSRGRSLNTNHLAETAAATMSPDPLPSMSMAVSLVPWRPCRA